ncbi:rhodanese-like domain-containing protein [Bacillus spongiae]|uniref:Rhodanese-like domain-containing protein n=1 Tax=Bacillus spongiae TaxID=2683610 RepID=A0ABU8HG44_9BACI
MYRISLKGARKLATWQILLVIIFAIIVYSVVMYLRQKRILNALSEDDFRAGYRKAQLIDVREQNEFEGGHILGARNIPLSQLKTRIAEIRPDKPVYLYCQSGMRCGRAAGMLYRKGYKDLNHLQGGFKKWTGKIKKKN